MLAVRKVNSIVTFKAALKILFRAAFRTLLYVAGLFFIKRTCYLFNLILFPPIHSTLYMFIFLSLLNHVNPCH